MEKFPDSFYPQELKDLHLTIREVTTYDVDPEALFENPSDANNYIKKNTVDTKLQLIDEHDHVIVNGDIDDIKMYLSVPF